MPERDDEESEINERIRARMERYGIPRGTDNPMLLAQGADPLPDTDEANRNLTKRLYATDDAMVWAEEWVATAAQIVAREGDWMALLDAGWMVSWFANAMQIAVDHHERRKSDG